MADSSKQFCCSRNTFSLGHLETLALNFLMQFSFRLSSMHVKPSTQSSTCVILLPLKSRWSNSFNSQISLVKRVSLFLLKYNCFKFFSWLILGGNCCSKFSLTFNVSNLASCAISFGNVSWQKWSKLKNCQLFQKKLVAIYQFC